MSHTPGPWRVESDGTTVAMGGQAVIVAPAPDGATRETEKANARLIAAAPDLLEAVAFTIAALEQPGHFPGDIDAILRVCRPAILAAGGRR